MQPAEFSTPIAGAGGGHMTEVYKKVMLDYSNNVYTNSKDASWPTAEEVKQRPDYIAWKAFADQAMKEKNVYMGKREAAGLEPTARSRSKPRKEATFPPAPRGQPTSLASELANVFKSGL